jgi:hypothetical protein
MTGDPTDGGTTGKAISGNNWTPFAWSTSSSAAGIDVYFGHEDFPGTVPTGYKEIATQNLPAATIDVPSLHMNTVLYTGTGATQAITGVGFQPDFVWIKSRTSAYYHRLQDSVRGATKEIYSNATSAEVTDATTLSSFDSDGFTVETQAGYNASLEPYVAWCWKAGGAASSNTDGSITATVSANQTAGFSVVKFTGTGANATVGHGLGVAPKFILTKSLGIARNWYAYHVSTGNTIYFLLNTNDSQQASPSMWQSTTPTSSVFYTTANSQDSAVSRLLIAGLKLKASQSSAAIQVTLQRMVRSFTRALDLRLC